MHPYEQDISFHIVLQFISECTYNYIPVKEMSPSVNTRHTAALILSVFALLSVTLYTGLIYALWTTNTQIVVLKVQTTNLEKQNAIFEERLQIIEAREFQQDSNEPVTVMNTLKRMTKRQVI